MSTQKTTSPEVRHVFNLTNEVESRNESITVSGSGENLDLSLELSAEETTVFEFTGSDEEHPGNHTLRVREEAEGIVIATETGIEFLPWPEHPALLVFRNGEPGWFEVEDPEKDLLLGIGIDNSFRWYEMTNCDEEC